MKILHRIMLFLGVVLFAIFLAVIGLIGFGCGPEQPGVVEVGQDKASPPTSGDFSDWVCYPTDFSRWSLSIDGWDVVLTCSTNTVLAGWQTTIGYDSTQVQLVGYSLRDSIYLTNWRDFAWTQEYQDAGYTVPAACNKAALLQIFSGNLYGVAPGEYEVGRWHFQPLTPDAVSPVGFAEGGASLNHAASTCLQTHMPPGVYQGTCPECVRPLWLDQATYYLPGEIDTTTVDLGEPPHPATPFFDVQLPSQMSGGAVELGMNTNAALTTALITIEYDSTRCWFTGIGLDPALAGWQLYVNEDPDCTLSNVDCVTSPGVNKSVRLLFFGNGTLWKTGQFRMATIGFVGWGPLKISASCTNTSMVEVQPVVEHCFPTVQWAPPASDKKFDPQEWSTP